MSFEKSLPDIFQGNHLFVSHTNPFKYVAVVFIGQVWADLDCDITTDLDNGMGIKLIGSEIYEWNVCLDRRLLLIS